MTTTADCKELLESDPRTAGHARGGWKRLSKRTAPDGVERIFANKTGDCFARVLQSSSGLLVDKVGASRADIEAKPPTAPHPNSGMVAVDLFQMFPPDMGLADDELLEIMDPDEEGECDLARMRADYLKLFSGRLVYAINSDALEEDTLTHNGWGTRKLHFSLGFEVRGYLYDQHCQVYDEMLPRIFPGLASHLEVGISEGMHALALEPDQCAKQTWDQMVNRMEALGAVALQAPLSKNTSMVQASDPIFSKAPLTRPTHRP